MKKTIKSLLILLLVGSMMLALTGCGDKKTARKSDEKEFVETKQETNVIVEEKQETNVVETAKPEFSMGKWNGNAYTNDFLGLKFNLPQGWTALSDAEIAQMMNVGAELLNDDQKALAQMAELTAVYYMVAKNPNTGNNVTIYSEKQFTEVSAESYIEALKTQLSAVQSINYEVTESSKENVSGIECNTLTLNANMSGVKMIQKYYIYKIDKYIIGIIATSTNGETGINEIASCFK